MKPRASDEKKQKERHYFGFFGRDFIVTIDFLIQPRKDPSRREAAGGFFHLGTEPATQLGPESSPAEPTATAQYFTSFLLTVLRKLRSWSHVIIEIV